MSKVTRLAALEADDRGDFWGNANPKCPHCGTDYNITEREAWELYDQDEGQHEIECPSCDLKYTVQVRVSYTFDTEEQEEEDEEE